MPVITGGNVIRGGTVIAPAADRIIYTNGVPTDALVSGGYAPTPSNGQLAQDINTGFVYERQAGAYVRVDTITPHPN